MKEFIEKLIGRLEENGQKMCEAKSSVPFGKHSPANHRYYKAISVKKAIFIINQLAEEYKQDIETIDVSELFGKNEQVNNGWIPVSERLPEGKESHKVLVTDKDGIMAVCYFLEVTKIFKVCWDGEEFQGVLAWQPLPAPYQPKGE